MNRKHNKTEKGQAIVYLAIGFVIFLGFVALAIDGGMVLADRRDAQNATDASSLAGVSAAAQITKNTIIQSGYVDSACSYSLLHDAKLAAIEAAKNRATSNSYTITKSDTPNVANTVYVKCGVDIGPYMDVSVEISKTTPTSFLQVLVPNSTLTNEMSSIARLHTARAIGGDYTLVSLGSTLGIKVSGDSNLGIIGGGVFGNYDFNCGSEGKHQYLTVCEPGTSYDDCVAITDPNDPRIIDHSIDIVGDPIKCNTQVVPTPESGATYMDPSLFELPAPDCTGHNYGHGYANLPSNLDPGLYCVHGPYMISGSIKGDGVTLYLMDGVGVKWNAGDNIELKAATRGTEVDGAVPALLLWSPLSNTAEIQENGTASGYFYGTWLLPKMNVTLPGWKGTFQGEFHGQMIVGDFDMQGTFDGGIFYDEEYIYTIPASIDLLH
jgi:Flp pilus assembly protein TadG